jgi:hypothetical protein
MYELEQLAKEALLAANAAEASAELEKLLAERVPELITQE